MKTPPPLSLSAWFAYRSWTVVYNLTPWFAWMYLGPSGLHVSDWSPTAAPNFLSVVHLPPGRAPASDSGLLMAVRQASQGSASVT